MPDEPKTPTTRVHISRIVAVNWYGYRQFIDVSGLSLITGANGSGKSALLDLIQFVMLGEGLSRFNKAAAGAGSGRTLKGYCLCDTNTLGRDGQERFLRPSSVTLAGLEFSWPLRPGEETPRRETWGARIEYEGPTSKPRTLWFMAGRRLEHEDFLSPNLDPNELSFMPEDEFRVHVQRDLEGQPFDRITTYHAEMASRAHLGFDAKQMHKTLPNAMAFQPVESFEKFIREYLLEPGFPDVKAVRASVDAHRNAQARLEKMHEQLERLDRICARHSDYLKARREAAIYAHLRDALMHEEREERLVSHRSKLDGMREQNAEHEADQKAALAERADLQRQLEEVRHVVGNDGQIGRLAENRARHDELRREVETLRESGRVARQFLRERTQHWKLWLQHGAELGMQEPEDAAEGLAIMAGNDEARGLDAVSRMARVFDQTVHEGLERLRPIEANIKDLESRELRLRRELDSLHEGRAAPSPLLDALRARGQRAVALGRVIEVKPEAQAWWPLLESLLGTERQAVLAEDFNAAWEHAQRVDNASEPLINTNELNNTEAAPKAGAVASFFETKHKGARAYLDGKYGDLVPVEKSSQLDKHHSALSRDGWLKFPPLRVKLMPDKELTIGEEGLRRLRQMRHDELDEVHKLLAEQKQLRTDWRTWMNRGKEWKLDDAGRPQGTDGLWRLPESVKELQGVDETIRLLATPEREETVEKLRQLETTFMGVVERVGRLGERLSKFQQQERELLESIASAEEEERSAFITRQASLAQLHGIREAEVNEQLEAAKSQYPKWSQRCDAAASVARTRSYDADKAKQQRDIERRALAETHPEVAEAFDPADDENDRYEARRNDLATHELERFKQIAEDARKEWEDRLQHQVLDVLKERLEEAERTKRELNRAMDHDIGGWRYQLTMRADRSHSAIWMLVDKGLNPGLELFAAGVKEEVEKAKAELMAAIENSEDPRHQRALDYRYYHHWDIQAQPTGKSEAAAISLNKSAKKQSGGENQAPFFVAMLAAFQR
ncbi:MAG: hypothetical protein JWO89_9, partial [Verrucomicrobiaceae bacterium]|nr:hypothetical protein [Verrucomicrobiaceae bacterium]